MTGIATEKRLDGVRRRYGGVDKVKEDGAHFTPKELADFVASQMVSRCSTVNRSSPVRVLDPAVGDGELLLSLVTALKKHSESEVHVHGFDTNPEYIRKANLRLKESALDARISIRKGDFLEHVLEHFSAPTLFSTIQSTEEQYDLVISNPPYVRTQVLGAEQAKLLAKQFGLSGRVDLYHAFIHGISLALRPGGILGIIVSNRFMTTRSGTSVRRHILDEFHVLHVWDLGDTRLFEAAVLPAVLLLERKGTRKDSYQSRFTSIYTSQSSETGQRHRHVIEALKTSGLVEIIGGSKFLVKQGSLDCSGAIGSVWRNTDEESKKWLDTVDSHTLKLFGEVGKIRVGVKTTADKVFIRSDWDQLPEDERPELLRPLLTHHSANRFRALQEKPKKMILYPHLVEQGKRIAADLTCYPRSEKYLNKYREVLESRRYVIESGRRWYEIWVPQDPDAWGQAKIVFRDIAEKPTFWMDLDGSIVNGDCYWITANDPEGKDLLWLMLAVGNSSFIETFYDKRFNNKLYAGRRRFMTQYVEQFPLPDPEGTIARSIIQLTEEIYGLTPSTRSPRLESELDNLVWAAFGLLGEEFTR